jgi:enamine deaminase RidA (YjgF/YER057c/UK114 family)
MAEILQPEGWPAPAGYSNGVSARGRVVFVAGQVGWDESGRMVSDDFVAQCEQALRNIAAVLAAGGAAPAHVTRMTWYVTDLDAYRASLKALGGVYRDVMGAHYPAMTLVRVAGLLEEGAKVEIEATAVVPEDAS